MEGTMRTYGVWVAGLVVAVAMPTAAAQMPEGVGHQAQNEVRGAEAYTFPQETNLVQFRYDPNRTYEILARPEAPTNIALEPGESLVALAIGDTVQWQTEDVDGHIFVKPLRSGIYTAGTIVTDRRSYQISLRAVDESSQWYQRVSWDYEARQSMLKQGSAWGQASGGDTAEAPEASMPDVPEDQDGNHPRPQDLNFGYSIEGASGLVQNAFDDGDSMWIRLDDGIQELPAVFVEGRRNSQALANYRVDGDYIIIHRLVDRAMLRIGDEEVIIERG